MEYVNGCDLEHLGTEKAKAAFEEHVCALINFYI